MPLLGPYDLNELIHVKTVPGMYQLPMCTPTPANQSRRVKNSSCVLSFIPVAADLIHYLLPRSRHWADCVTCMSSLTPPEKPCESGAIASSISPVTLKVIEIWISGCLTQPLSSPIFPNRAHAVACVPLGGCLGRSWLETLWGAWCWICPRNALVSAKAR